MPMIEEGKKAPDFCLPNQDETEICLRDLSGKWIVLYFYPKDNTPGCTTEACDFTELNPKFEDMDAVVIGVSPDSPKKHQNFIEKHNLEIMLLCDESKEMMKTYGAFGTKKMYGKEVQGVIRSTYIIDPKGNVPKTWTNVRAKGHAEKVKEALESLKG